MGMPKNNGQPDLPQPGCPSPATSLLLAYCDAQSALQLVVYPPGDQDGPCRGVEVLHVGNHGLFLGIWELPCQQRDLLSSRWEAQRDSCQNREESPMKCPGAMLHPRPPAELGSPPGIQAERDVQQSQHVSGPSVQGEAMRDGGVLPLTQAQLSGSETD